MKVNIIAHRGIFNNDNIPENSLYSFKEAINKKIPIELDIHLSSDNKIVVFHDDNLFRMTSINKNIEDMKYNELAKINLLNTKEHIPTLDEVLKLINGQVLLIIEIKKNKKWRKLISLLIEALNNYQGKVLIQSFDFRVIKKIKKQYCCGLLLTKKYNNIKLDILIHKLLLFYCRPNFISINKKLLKYKYYKKITNKYKTYLWTIKNKEEINKYSDYELICNNLFNTLS